jgi:hypothetical protein
MLQSGSKLPRVGATRKEKKVGLERGPLSLVRIIKELSEKKSSGSGLKNRN